MWLTRLNKLTRLADKREIRTWTQDFGIQYIVLHTEADRIIKQCLLADPVPEPHKGRLTLKSQRRNIIASLVPKSNSRSRLSSSRRTQLPAGAHISACAGPGPSEEGMSPGTCLTRCPQVQGAYFLLAPATLVLFREVQMMIYFSLKPDPSV